MPRLPATPLRIVALSAFICSACLHIPVAGKQKEAAEVHNDLGAAAFKNGRYQEAMKEFQAALDIDPDFAFAHAGMGSVYMYHWTGPKLDEAKKEFLIAIGLDKHYATAWNNLGTIYAEQGDLPHAQDAFEHALAEPTYDTPWIAQTNLGWILHLEGKSEAGKRFLQQALLQASGYCQAHRQFARLLADEGKAGAADNQWEAFAKACPREPDAAFHEGGIFMKRGELAGAANWFHACDEIAGSNPPGDDCRRAFAALPADIQAGATKPLAQKQSVEFNAPNQGPVIIDPLVTKTTTTPAPTPDPQVEAPK